MRGFFLHHFSVSLRQFHKTLIAMAIGLAVLYSAFSAYRFGRTGERIELILATVAVVMAGALSYYLRAFIRKGR